MLARHAAFAFTAAFLATTAVAAEAPRNMSWGKAGVSLDQYRTDAAECAYQAVSLDVSGTQAAHMLVRASRELDQVADTAWMDLPSFGSAPMSGIGGNGGIAWQQTINKYRPGEQFAAIRDLQYRTLTSCLSGRGYSRFQLTADQAAQLRHLKRGSDARRAYLHGLASDPQVMERQHI
ncbi:MAG TPA: hypothetical protein VFW19_07910 [Allosphingosinicella sp.]|nr:hypothetical protein [Allosphingosinicella sp.]